VTKRDSADCQKFGHNETGRMKNECGAPRCVDWEKTDMTMLLGMFFAIIYGPALDGIIQLTGSIMHAGDWATSNARINKVLRMPASAQKKRKYLAKMMRLLPGKPLLDLLAFR
jgi:hypothetical protein